MQRKSKAAGALTFSQQMDEKYVDICLLQQEGSSSIASSNISESQIMHVSKLFRVHFFTVQVVRCVSQQCNSGRVRGG